MKRYIANIIILGIFCLLVLLLAGCAKSEPVSSTIADNAVNNVTALEQALPAECKTDAIVTQLTVIKTEIRAVKKSCDAEKDVITKEKLKWKMSFWGLVCVIGLYISRRFLKLW